jgi:large subunit ribosomal protein L24
MKVKVGDTVKVIAGDERGQTGKVIRVLTKKDKVVVEGVNKVFKHVRRSQKNPQGGRLSMEMPVHVSNVALVNAAGAASRVGMRTTSDGGKERYFKKGGASAGLVTPSKAQRLANRKKKK